jgi:ribonucleoside-triphosphate reductase
LNAEIHKSDNIEISRAMVMDKLKELYPSFRAKTYLKDLKSHIIYKHDESSFAGAISPYCVSLTMYPFLTNGIKRLGGLSAAPKNIDSFCGMFVNLIFATAAQFAGAVATPEFLLYFTYFAEKEWGHNFWKHPDLVVTMNTTREKTIRKQIRQYFQQVVYSINQPAAARGMQSAFWNVAYFDKTFFDGMFGDFYFPDGRKPDWESLEWIQKEFMQWFITTIPLQVNATLSEQSPQPPTANASQSACRTFWTPISSLEKSGMASTLITAPRTVPVSV